MKIITNFGYSKVSSNYEIKIFHENILLSTDDIDELILQHFCIGEYNSTHEEINYEKYNMYFVNCTNAMESIQGKCSFIILYNSRYYQVY